MRRTPAATRAFGRDLEEPDLAGLRQVRAAAQLGREIADAAPRARGRRTSRRTAPSRRRPAPRSSSITWSSTGVLSLHLLVDQRPRSAPPRSVVSAARARSRSAGGRAPPASPPARRACRAPRAAPRAAGACPCGCARSLAPRRSTTTRRLFVAVLSSPCVDLHAVDDELGPRLVRVHDLAAALPPLRPSRVSPTCPPDSA